MARSFWVATCPFGWGVGSTKEQATSEMCRSFRELPREQVDVWTFKVKGYQEVGPNSITSDSLEAAVCYRGVPTEHLLRVHDLHSDLAYAVEDALCSGDREAQVEEEVD